jgi:hypothetical protein
MHKVLPGKETVNFLAIFDHMPAIPSNARGLYSVSHLRYCAAQMSKVLRFCQIALLFCLNAGAGELLPPGFRPVPLGVHALVGGKVVIKPGDVVSNATIVIRDGLIKAVGPDAAVPADARVWDMKGATIYAGFIDPYIVTGATNSPVSTSDSEPITFDTLTAGGVNFFGAPGQATDRGRTGP